MFYFTPIMFIGFIVLVILPAGITILRSFKIKLTSGPSCPKCGKNLHGDTSDTCDNCGTELNRSGVFPPHRLSKTPMILTIVISAATFLLLTFLISLFIPKAIHRAYAEGRISLAHAESCAYELIEVKFSGEAYGPGGYKSLETPPVVPIDIISLSIHPSRGNSELRINLKTKQFHIAQNDERGTYSDKTIGQWLKAHDIGEPIDRLRWLLLPESSRWSLKNEQVNAMPVGEIQAEIDLLNQLISWSMDPSMRIHGDDAINPSAWPKAQGMDATRRSPRQTGLFRVVEAEDKPYYKRYTPPRWMTDSYLGRAMALLSTTQHLPFQLLAQASIEAMGDFSKKAYGNEGRCH